MAAPPGRMSYVLVATLGAKGTVSGRRVLRLNNSAAPPGSRAGLVHVGNLRDPGVSAHPQIGVERDEAAHKCLGTLCSGCPRNRQVQFFSPVPSPHCPVESFGVSWGPEYGDSDTTSRSMSNTLYHLYCDSFFGFWLYHSA